MDILFSKTFMCALKLYFFDVKDILPLEIYILIDAAFPSNNDQIKHDVVEK